jgi:hypothetical protein
VFASLHDSPQEYKQLYEDPLFLIKVRSYNSNFAFTSIGASLAENVRIDEQLANVREGGKPSVFKEQYAVVLVYCHLLNEEHQVLPVCTFSMVIRKGCCIMDGLDRKIVLTIQRVVSKLNSFVEMLLRDGEFIRNQEVLNVRLATHEDPGVDW